MNINGYVAHYERLTNPYITWFYYFSPSIVTDFPNFLFYYLFLLFQSALTGESLPVTKHSGDGVYSGSTCKQGELEAIVIATGVHTFFGKAAHLVESTTHVGHFQQVPF